MAKSVNRVTLVGNLGQDPEVKVIPSGSSVCNLSIATTESYKDRTSGEWKETTDWHRIVLWERLAEIAGQYLKKGSKVYIEGQLKTRSYEAKDGSTRYMTEVRASNLIMMGGSGQGGGGGSYSNDNSSQSNYSQPSSNENKATEHLPEDEFDDEVPF